MLRGSAWALPDSGDPWQLRPGDAAIVGGSDFYTVADDPAPPPGVVVYPGG